MNQLNQFAAMVMFSAAIFATTSVHAQQVGPVEKTARAPGKASSVEEFDKQADQVRENIAKMQSQMEKIRQTKDPKERQKLLQEHWATMQSGMAQMHGLWGTSMMGGPMMHGPGMGGPGMGGRMMGSRKMGDYYSKLTPEQMKQHQYMMDQYMGMQQQMLDHMMQHQNQMWMQPPR